MRNVLWCGFQEKLCAKHNYLGIVTCGLDNNNYDMHVYKYVYLCVHPEGNGISHPNDVAP